MHSLSSHSFSYLWLRLAMFISLFNFSRENILWRLFDRSTNHRFWALAYRPQTINFSLDIFLRRLLWVFERETNESITKGLRSVTKWITFDSLAHFREFWRQPDPLERKESWSPQDVTILSIKRRYLSCLFMYIKIFKKRKKMRQVYALLGGNILLF